jgi:hypothetical protein
VELYAHSPNMHPWRGAQLKEAQRQLFTAVEINRQAPQHGYINSLNTPSRPKSQISE